MANPSPTVMRSGLRRALRAVAALLAGVLVTTCADNPTAPNRPGFGSVSIQPGFDQYALFAPVVLNQVRAIVVRPPSDTVVDTLVTFRATDAQVRLTLRIPLQATSETMGVGLQLLAGNVLLFSGTEDVVVRQGVTAPATSIPMTYQGPGSNATSLELAPDTTLRVGSTAQMRATARDVEGVDVGQFYLNWSLVGTAPGATIDATGLLHASTSAGTFFVRGITPGGLRDSVQITVLPAPSTLAKSAGDAQTALVGTRLANPLVVLVTGAGGVPVPGVTVSFTATTGGGTVDSATATTNAQGLALSGVTLGAATGAQTFTVSSTGLASVVFTATAQGAGPQTRTWSGVVSTDFSAAGNWVGGIAPAIGDGVIIGAATNQPSLTATTTVGSVTINSGGVLTVNNQTIVISGNLTTAGTGVLRMLNSGDGVGVTGNAVFGGGDESGLLTAGVLQIGGSFTQTSGTSTNSFRATGSHATAFTGTAPSVTFASGSAATSSFQSLAWTAAASSTMTLGSAVFVKGSFSTSGGGATGLTSTNGSRLTVLGDFAAVLPLVLNNVPVTIDQATAGTVFAGAGLTFQNMATNVSQLVIRHPGLGAPIALPSMTFSTVPVAPNGFYLDVTDITADANVLTVNLTGATPASGGAFVRTTGGAIVNWPLNAAVRTWTGAVSNNWSVAGNWNGGVPGGSDSAVIVAATNAPQLTTETSVGAVSITGGTLLVNGHGLSVARGLSTSGTGVLVMSNPSDEVSIAGNATFGGGDASDALVAGDLTIGGNLVQTSANSPFSFSASGTHVTLFTSGAHTISFATPEALVGSGFNDVEFFGNGTTTLTTETWARGTMDINGTGQIFTSSNGSRLGIERLIATAPVTFNNVPLLINQSQATPITDQPLTFQNMATNVVQLEVRHPGGSGPLTLTNFVFSTTPVAPNGFYLRASDNVADATPLVITMVGATPATGAPFVQTAGGATVNWASSATLRTWTGALNSDWTITNNWAGGVVPVNGDDVLIPDAPAHAPLFAGATTLRNLTIESESGTDVLTVDGDGGLGITGNIDNQGRIVGSATIALVGAGPHTISGEISRLTVNGNTTLSDNTVIPGTLQVTSGIFNLGSDQNLQVGGDFRLINSGRLQMDGSTNMQVDGNVEFTGASTAGLLTGGTIQVRGNFTASATDGAYAPDAAASVSLTGTGEQRITLGSTASYFANLAIIQSGGGSVVLMSDVTVFGTFGGGGVVLGAHTLTVGLINAGNVTFNETRLVWNSTSADPPFSFNNFTFENYSAAAPQFTINHPGVVGNPITLNGITFSGTPNPYFLQVNDNASDGVPLIVNLTNANPASGAGLFNVTNGATVNWPPASTVWAWTGATSTNWSVAANWDRNSIPPTNADVTIGAALNQPTLSADVSVNSVLVSQAGARLTLGGHTLTVAGNFTTHTDGLLVSTNPADRLIVGALAAFQGGDETGLITAGELRLNGSFIQQVQTSPFSFLASGSHRTILTNTSLLQNVQFCCTANTSKFMNLDISNSFGINIQFAANGVFVADTFIVQPGAGPRPWLYMLGSPLTARRFKINRLLVDRGTLTLNENGVAGTQQLDSVTFQNYLTTQTQLAVTAAGTRTLTFNNLVFQALTTGNTGRYLNATASTGTLTLDLTSANVANGPAFTTINGNAIANWPGSTPVNTWSGAVNTAWTNTGNWSLGRLPAATDSVVIPNAVTNFPTLTGRQVVGAMFVDGRLLINGGVLVVNRSMPGNNGVNRIIQLTQATDSLIVTGSVATGISATLGVAVINGDLTGSSVFATGARLVLSGAGTQNVLTTGGLLVVNKPTGTAVLSSPFNGDSIDVISGSLDAPSTNIAVATGLSSRAGTSVSSGAILQVGTNLTVLGNYSVNITRFKPQLPAITIPVLSYTNLYIEQGSAASVVSLGGRTVTSADVLVTAAGTPVELNLNGHTLVVGNNLSTSGPGIASIRMNNPIDSLLVNGNATFSHASGANPGNFTAGVLRVGGNLIQSNAQFGGPNFQSTNTHKVILTAFNPVVGFDNPGPATNQSHLNDLTWTGAGTLNVGGVDSLVINGRFTTTSATPVTVIAPGINRSIRFGSLAATAQVTFSQIRVIVSQPSVPSPGPDLGLNNMRFFNQDPARIWLTIEHPGFTGGLSVSNVTFTTVPNNGGFYIRAVDNNPSDGLPLVVNVTNTTPTSPGGLTQVANGATINWPFVPAAATWTGTVSAAWENPANWNVGAVPGSITAVTIPAGTPFAPTAGAVVSSVGNLAVASGATLTLASPFNLAVSGNVDAQGTIAPNSQALSMIGANVTLRGNVPQLAVSGIVTLNGNTTAASNGPCVFNGTAELIVNGFTFSCFQLQFNNTARIQMTNPADSVVVLGSTQFSGGSTLGRLTAGVLDLRGSFQQTGTNSVASFASTGTRVRVSGTGATTFAMGTGGPGQSQFRSLLISRTGGTMTMSGPLVYVTDSMIVSSAIPISIPGTLNPNKLRLAAGAGLTGAGSIQINGDSLFVATPANYAIGNTLLDGTPGGNQVVPALPYPSVTLQGSATHTLVARTATTGPVFVIAGNLVPGGRTLSTAAGLQIQNDGALIMNNPLDSVLVGGNAFFLSPNDATGNLTAGVLRIAQNMTVDNSPTAFVASGTHKTILASVATSNVNWTGLGIVPIQFQNLEANANNLSINYARVNGTMNVTGTGGMNVGRLDVRGQLTTASTAGMGIDSLFLGAAVPIAPGSGRVAANVYILDNGGTQSIPTLPIPTAGGADSSALVIRSNITVPGGLVPLKSLRIDGSGRLDLNGQTVNVNGDFWTANNGTVVMQNAADRLNVTGTPTFGGGDESGLLIDGIFTTSGRFTQDNTNSNSSFVATGNHTTRFTSVHPDGNIVFFASPQASAFMNLETSVPITYSSNILIFNNFTNSATTGTTTALRVAVQGNYTQSGGNTFTPRRFVFYGTLSTAMTVTAGSFRPDTIQFNDGLVPNLPVNANIVYNVAEVTGAGTVVTLGATAPTWNSLTISGTAQLNLNGRALNVAGPLIASAGTVLGNGAASSLQARRFQVTALTVDNARLILDEQGTTQAQTITNIVFQNLAAPGGTGLFTVTAVGNNGTPRSLGLGINFNTTLSGGQRYLTLASSNTQSLTANVSSNVSGAAVTAAGGASPTIGSTVNGATIVWP